MKKKTFIFSLILYLLCIALAGCGTNTDRQPPGTIPPATDETDVPDATVPDNPTTPDDPIVATDTTPVPGDATSVPNDATPAPVEDPSASSTPSVEEPDASTEPETSPEPETGLRDNTPRCLVPTASGSAETHNEYAAIDYSNASEGYFMACYTGTCAKLKM